MIIKQVDLLEDKSINDQEELLFLSSLYSDENNHTYYTNRYTTKWFRSKTGLDVTIFDNVLVENSVYYNSETFRLYFNLNNEQVRQYIEKYFNVVIPSIHTDAVRFKNMPEYAENGNCTFTTILLGSVRLKEKDLVLPRVYYYVRDKELGILDESLGILEEKVDSRNGNIVSTTYSSFDPKVKVEVDKFSLNPYEYGIIDINDEGKAINMFNLPGLTSINTKGSIKNYEIISTTTLLPETLQKPSVQVHGKVVREEQVFVYFTCNEEDGDLVRDLLGLPDKYKFTHFCIVLNNQREIQYSKGYLYRYNSFLSEWPV